MGKKSAPPPPDYAGAAATQAAASQDIANQTNYANRPNVTTPWGSQTWTTNESIDPATGKKVTQWNSNLELTPEQQAALDSQQQIQQGRSGAAEDLLGQVGQNFSNPMDWSTLPSRSGNISAPGASDEFSGSSFNFGDAPGRQTMQTSLNGGSGDYRQRAQDAVTQLQAPGLKQRRENTQARLLNQGIGEGSEAWSNAMRDVDDAESRAGLMAISEGRNESSQAFGQDLSAGQFGNQARSTQFGEDLSGGQFENQRQGQDYDQTYRAAMLGDSRAAQQLQEEMQAGNFNNSNRNSAISEEQLKRGMTLNELNALLSGEQVQTPNMTSGNAPGAAGGKPADMMGALEANYGSQLDAQNAKNAGTGQLLSSLGSLASLFMFSDLRLKEDVRHIGFTSTGRRIVSFRFKKCLGQHVGVIAQENPDIAVEGPGGFLMVDYSKVNS